MQSAVRTPVLIFLIVSVSFAAGIALGYLGYRTDIALVQSVQDGLDTFTTLERDTLMSRRGTVRAISKDGSTITVQAYDLYDPMQKDMLTVKVDSADAASGIAIGQQIIFNLTRTPGRFHTNSVAQAGVI